MDEQKKKIANAEKEIKDLKSQNENLKAEILDKQKEINQLKSDLQGSIIPMENIKAYLNEYIKGWLTWMNGNRINEMKIKEVQGSYDEFMGKKFSDKSHN
jgi:predicted RNase H-like nuclease (RuvC/YqgF family)